MKNKIEIQEMSTECQGEMVILKVEVADENECIADAKREGREKVLDDL